MEETEKYFMFKIVYFVEWIENGVERSVWFLSYESAARFAKKSRRSNR